MTCLILIILISNTFKLDIPIELQLNKAKAVDNEVAFSDLDLSITNSVVSSKMYDKSDYFKFVTLNFLMEK